MNTLKSSKNAKVIRRIALAAAVLIVGGFVSYNIYASREIETVEQTVVSPVTNTPSTPSPESPAEVPAAPVVRTGSFQSLNGYTVSGDVSLIVENGERRLVFSDNFASSSGPDVLVYLSKNNTFAEGGALSDPISLGPIQSFNGSQTYVLPENSDEYSSVVIWCRAFSSAFGAASV